MKIELMIDGQKQLFTAPFVPMMAKRKFLEVTIKEQNLESPTLEQQIDIDDEMYTILTDVIFNKQFTLEDLYNGADLKYVQKKMREAIFGEAKENDEGNKTGE